MCVCEKLTFLFFFEPGNWVSPCSLGLNSGLSLSAPSLSLDRTVAIVGGEDPALVSVASTGNKGVAGGRTIDYSMLHNHNRCAIFLTCYTACVFVKVYLK